MFRFLSLLLALAAVASATPGVIITGPSLIVDQIPTTALTPSCVNALVAALANETGPATDCQVNYNFINHASAIDVVSLSTFEAELPAETLGASTVTIGLTALASVDSNADVPAASIVTLYRSIRSVADAADADAARVVIGITSSEITDWTTLGAWVVGIMLVFSLLAASCVTWRIKADDDPALYQVAEMRLAPQIDRSDK
jgi:hypothetical protein